MAYIEADLKSELVKAFKEAGCVCHKFPDFARGLKKPHDLVACVRGRYVGIETKLKKTGAPGKPGRWSDRLIVLGGSDTKLSVLQRENLQGTLDANGCAWVIGGLYCRNNYQRAAWALNYRTFEDLEQWSLGDLREYAFPLYWTPGKGWDLERMLQVIRG